MRASDHVRTLQIVTSQHHLSCMSNKLIFLIMMELDDIYVSNQGTQQLNLTVCPLTVCPKGHTVE